jgi:solute:Na+ symporter, SSS family
MAFSALNGIDYGIIIAYLVSTVLFGLYIGRKMHTGDDYFLAGRSLPWWAIGMSLVVTDIGATDMVGIAGSAYLYGIVLGNYDWLGSVPVMIIGAFLFIPILWKSNVTTIPEWLGRRYNTSVRTVSAMVWGVYLSMGLGITLYATAVMFNFLMDLNPKVLVVGADESHYSEIVQATGAKKSHRFIKADTVLDAATLIENEEPHLVLVSSALAGADTLPSSEHIPVVVFGTEDVGESWGAQVMQEARPGRWSIMKSVILIGILVGGYTMFGGLKAVVYTDVIQCVVMLGGSLFVLVFGIYKLGGVGDFVTLIQDLGQRTAYHFDLVVPMDAQTPHPWSGIFLGLGLVLANAYWLGNQAIVQRTLGARTMADARAAYVLGSLLKILIPFAMVVPGIIALAHNPNIVDADTAMASLVRDIMPSCLLGIFFAAFLAGLMSSVDSALNSSATIWTKDIYQRFIKPDGTGLHYLIVGRIITVFCLALAIYFASFGDRFDSLYTFTQTMLTTFQGPSLAIILLGVLWKRINGKGALAGLITGLISSTGMYQVNNYATEPLFQIDDPFLYIAWWSFVVTIVVTIGVSLVTKPPTDEHVQGLVYHNE